jgi:hypothetical protein
MTNEPTGLQAPETQNPVTGEVKTSKSAIWSLVCGIAGTFLCLPAIAGIILGIIAMVNINKSRGVLKGMAMAIVGLVLSCLSMVTAPFIIGIVAAIVIPNVLTGRMSANEAMATANLKQLCSSEAAWRQQDADGNGIKDYWTYDVSCLHRMYRLDNTTKINLIDLSLARADSNSAVDNLFGAKPAIESWSSGPTQMTFETKGGYYYQAMKTDETETPYNQNEVGENKIKAANETKFAFIAYPSNYGRDGVSIYIVNEQGIVYRTDPCGNGEGKIVLQWPGADPELVTGPGGRKWSRAN